MNAEQVNWWIDRVINPLINVGLYVALGFLIVWSANGVGTAFFSAESIRGGVIAGGMRATVYLMQRRGLVLDPRGDTDG